MTVINATEPPKVDLGDVLNQVISAIRNEHNSVTQTQQNINIAPGPGAVQVSSPPLIRKPSIAEAVSSFIGFVKNFGQS
ncbi:hypothetical protein BVY02_01650, partial [bacterium J17]